MASRRRFEDDSAWNNPGIGGDPDKPRKPRNGGVVARLGEAFWRACDIVPLSTPRWGSKPRMNANLKFMLQTHGEDEIADSFIFFRTDTPSITLNANHPCWEAYFRHRGTYLRAAARAREGRRSGQAVHNAGDITVDNERFRVRDPGDATTAGADD